jgi:hypothetical protein
MAMYFWSSYGQRKCNVSASRTNSRKYRLLKNAYIFIILHPLVFYLNHTVKNRSRDCSVRIVTVYWLDGRGSFPAVNRLFPLLYPPVQWVRGVLGSRVKRPRLEADHSALSSTDFRNYGTVPLLPLASCRPLGSCPLPIVPCPLSRTSLSHGA